MVPVRIFCSTILAITLLGQFGLGFWPFIPFDMFTGLAQGRHEFLLIESEGPDGARLVIPSRQVLTPLRFMERQKFLLNRIIQNRTPDQRNVEFCRVISRWYGKSIGKVLDSGKPRIFRLVWVRHWFSRSDKETKVLASCRAEV